MNRIILFFTLLVTTFFYSFSQPKEEARLLRFPAIHNEQVIFVYAGDLYTVNMNDGLARKLTNDREGFEMFPRFSPDGKTIAFTAQYDGNTEVYTMPATGGIPKRLTYTATLSRDDVSDRMGPNNIVMTWTPDGENILYRSRKQSFNSFVGQLFKVSIHGGVSEEIPLITGSWCSFAPDGKLMAMNRVFREFRTWKYYKGGMADDIWIFNQETGNIENVTNNPAQDIFPMWYGDNIFFCSDRDRIMNIFCYNTKTKDTKKITNFDVYDVKFPSAGNSVMIFENGGYLYTLDPKTEKVEKLSIYIDDDGAVGRNKMKDATKNIAEATLSPDGNRAVFTARGDIFTVPAKSGVTRNITKSSGAHDRNAIWAPDGKTIAYISDMDGEFEIYIQAQDGLTLPMKITSNTGTYIFNIQWSPDGKKILYSDKMMRLQYVDVESKKITLIERNPYWEIRDYDWSPDSKWVAYASQSANSFNTVHLYSLIEKKNYMVTDQWYSSFSPIFSDDGNYLFFISARDFNPTYSSTEWNHVYNNMSRIYLVPLTKEAKNPFEYKNDEVEEIQDEDTVRDDKKSDKEKSKDKQIKIITENLSDKILALPLNPGGYTLYGCVKMKVYYYCNNSNALKMFDLKDDNYKETELGKKIKVQDISRNLRKFLVSNSDKYYIIDVPIEKIKLDNELNLADLKMWVNNKEEWAQIYSEAWRQMRDFFYVENMHGVDWKKMREKYEVLLPYIKCKDDLNYVIGELIGELNAGHAYINGGDKFNPERIKTGLLGAKLSRDKNGYYKITKILQGENWRTDLRSPLTEVGMNINEGDFIVAINGKSTKEMNDIYEMLVNTVDKEVLLSISTSPNEKSAKTVIIKPIADESGLYYFDWVRENIRKVNEATNGEVGYIHIPDMGVEGLNEFTKYFYSQLNKKALIIDDRGNGGGNVSPMILERLSREVQRANMTRNAQFPTQTPSKMMIGPKVCLINNYSASDGDLFPYGFRKQNLGKIIGVRSWGGVVGIRGSLPFVDGTILNKPEFTSFDAEGTGYIIEGYGVDPDIWLDNDPYKEYFGEDAQLNKAIEVILEELKNYKSLPPIPQAPER
jgi:tricorn protease